jgi:hypothetical protein
MTTVSALEASPALREMASAEPVFRTSSLSDEIAIHTMSYALVDGGRAPGSPDVLAAASGLSEVDRLNVCGAARRDAGSRHRRRGFSCGERALRNSSRANCR